MLKRDLFVAAMKAGLFKKTAWLISAFSITREGPDDWKLKPYAYRLVSTPTGMYFINPDALGELLKVEDATAGQALYRFKEKIEITEKDGIENLKTDGQPVISSYGNILFNYAVLIYAFGDKIPFHNPESKVKVESIDDIILPRLQDNPEGTEAQKPLTGENAPIYVSEYLKYADSMFFLTSLTQLCTYGATEKVLLPPPGIKEFKAKLLEQNKDHLDDMATVARIDKALVDYDSAWLKGDPAENFLIDGKSRNVVRRKLFLMTGAEDALDDSTIKANLIQNSLLEGWQVDKIPQMNNVLRAGSFNRGSQTQLGGVSVKWLLRASSNMNVTQDDCGSRLGNITLVTPENMKKLVGFSMVTQEGSKRIKSKEEAGAYLGKKLMMRSPMYCSLSRTDYCRVCVGERLTLNPDGLSVAVSDYGSAFLSLFLRKMHGSVLSLAKMNLRTAIF